MKYSHILIFLSFLFLPASFASAHQPYLVDGENQIVVSEPEISKAYYGEFIGEPTVFLIRESKPFDLYLNLLVPAIANVPSDVTAEVRHGDKIIATLSASSTGWVRMYEPYGGDDYFQGPEYRKASTSGNYTVTLSRPGNRGKYVLAVGEIESFTMDETIRTLGVLPELKSQFFGKPAWTAFFNRMGIFMLMAFVGFIIAFLLIGEFFRLIGRIWRKITGKQNHFHY